MVIVCPGCKNQITLDDATLPSGMFKVRCTGCGKTITTQRKEEAAAPPPAPATPPPKSSATITDKIRTTAAPSEPANASVETFVNAQIAVAKREILDAMQALFRGASIQQSATEDDLSVSKRSLICSGDPATAEILIAQLKPMGYQTQSSTTAADSLKNLDISFGLIVIDPSFTDDLDGARKIIGRINMKKGPERRQTFVVLLSSTQKTLDGNSAFMSGVNLIVNKADLNRLESVIRQGQLDFRQMYFVFQGISEDKGRS